MGTANIWTLGGTSAPYSRNLPSSDQSPTARPVVSVRSAMGSPVPLLELRNTPFPVARKRSVARPETRQRLRSGHQSRSAFAGSPVQYRLPRHQCGPLECVEQTRCGHPAKSLLRPIVRYLTRPLISCQPDRTRKVFPGSASQYRMPAAPYAMWRHLCMRLTPIRRHPRPRTQAHL